uniref:Uncharacterized protein n=1 Tax=Anguilla anguilla TaxID=7936 RepID=A0A0E9U0B2_ANGAN
MRKVGKCASKYVYGNTAYVRGEIHKHIFTALFLAPV